MNGYQFGTDILSQNLVLDGLDLLGTTWEKRLHRTKIVDICVANDTKKRKKIEKRKSERDRERERERESDQESERRQGEREREKEREREDKERERSRKGEESRLVRFVRFRLVYG